MKGGRKNLDASRRGAENFGRVAKGGAKNFGLGQFFFNVSKRQFFHVLWVFWALLIFWSKGGENFGHIANEGGGKFWTVNYFGFLRDV